MARPLRILIGLFLWSALAAALYGWIHDDTAAARDQATLATVREWVLDRRVPVRLELERAVEARVGDPVFLQTEPGALTQIGAVSALLEGERVLPRRAGRVRAVRCDVYRSAGGGLDASARARWVSVPQTAGWILSTLLPRERVLELARDWNATLVANREELFAAVQPVLEATVRDLQAIVMEDLDAAVGLRRDELSALGERLQRDVVEREFLPLVEQELWPVLMVRAQPTLDEIGKQVLERLPVWSFGWRFVYQSLPLTDDTYVRERWEPFVQQEVIPILKAHLPDFFGVAQDVFAAAARNPRVAAAFERSFDRLLADSELQRELGFLFQHLILDNPRFHAALLARWESPEMALALDRLAVFLGPFFKRVADEVLGTRGGGITPELARVLRTQILEKDRRFVVFERGPATAGASASLAAGHVFPASVVDDG